MSRIKAILLLIFAVGFAASPLFTDDFQGFDPDLFPIPQVDPPVQPAGYAFSIWGLIYAWLILHAGFGLLRRAEEPAWDAPRWALIFSLWLGLSWLWVANMNVILATIQIWLMLLGAAVALLRSPVQDRWLAQAPMAIYAGWLTAASCVSIGLILAGYGFMGQVPAAVVALLLAVGLGAWLQLMLARAPEYGLTVIWALVAVMAANWGAGWLIPTLSVAGIVVMAAATWRAGSGSATHAG